MKKELHFKCRLGTFQYGASNFIEYPNQPEFFIAPETLIDLHSGLLMLDVENYVFRNLSQGIHKKV